MSTHCTILAVIMARLFHVLLGGWERRVHNIVCVCMCVYVAKAVCLMISVYMYAYVYVYAYVCVCLCDKESYD